MTQSKVSIGRTVAWQWSPVGNNFGGATYDRDFGGHIIQAESLVRTFAQTPLIYINKTKSSKNVPTVVTSARSDGISEECNFGVPAHLAPTSGKVFTFSFF